MFFMEKVMKVSQKGTFFMEETMNILKNRDNLFWKSIGVTIFYFAKIIKKTRKHSGFVRWIISLFLSLVFICIYEKINNYIAFDKLYVFFEQLNIIGLSMEVMTRIYSMIVVSTIVSFIIYLSISLIKIYKWMSLVKNSGIYMACKNNTTSSGVFHEAIVKLECENTDTICIVCSTGQTTFSNEKNVFSECVKTANKVKILMADPTSPATKERMKNLNISEIEWFKEVNKAISFLEDLKRKGHDIKLRFHSTMPSTKLIILDRIAYVQRYEPEKHSDQSPRYGFKKDKFSMYEIFEDQFKRRWTYKRFQYDFSDGKAYSEDKSECINMKVEIKKILNSV